MELQVPRVSTQIEQVNRRYSPQEAAPLARATAQTNIAASFIAPEDGALLTPVSIDVNLLKQVSIGSGGLSAGARSVAPRSSPSVLSLDVGGNSLILRVTDVTYDARYDVHHTTAVILNRENGYARFTYDRTGDIVATIHLPGETYYVLPEGPRAQSIIRRNGVAGRAAMTQRPTVRANIPVARKSLLRRHAQMELIADLQPRAYMQSASNLSLYLEGSDLGTVAAVAPIGSALKDALLTLSPLTNARVDSDLRVTSEHQRRDGARIVNFVQLINGIPVNHSNEVIVDAAGRIVSIRSSLLSDAFTVAPLTLTEAEARRIALRTLTARSSSVTEIEQVKTTMLRYEFAVGGGSVEPIYHFSLRAGSPRTFADVLVNGSSGAVEVRNGSVQSSDANAPGAGSSSSPASSERASNASPAVSVALLNDWNPDIEIYNTVSGAPQSGADPGAQLVYGPAGCATDWTTCGSMTNSLVAFNIWFQWSTAVESWNGGACCENIHLDIVNNTPAADSGGAYLSATNSIVFPASGIGAGGGNPDAVLHEFGHAYIDQMNVPGNVGTDLISRAIREGIADAVAATYPAYEDVVMGRAYDYGQDWVLFDGANAYPSSVQRDLRTPRQWSEMTSATGHHAAGEVIGNFFYRMRLGWFNTNPTAMVVFVQKVSYYLSDVQGDGQIDLLDFKRAAYLAVNNDSAGVAYINSTWEAMSTQQIPGQQPPTPPGVPAAPANVLSVPTGCVSGFSTYTVHWDAPANTTYYRTYVRLPSSPIYTVSDRIDAPQNWGFGYTNYDTDARVAACNSAGCSWMSAAAAAMPHNQCGF